MCENMDITDLLIMAHFASLVFYFIITIYALAQINAFNQRPSFMRNPWIIPPCHDQPSTIYRKLRICVFSQVIVTSSYPFSAFGIVLRTIAMLYLGLVTPT